MKDERTPDTYFQQTDKTREALNNIVKRLDDLKSKLQHLKQRGGTKAHKVIINKEIEEGKNKFYRELSRRQIDKAIHHFILTTHPQAFPYSRMRWMRKYICV